MDAASTNPVAPYAVWATAASTIQDAVDAARTGDTVRVTNGVYAAGGRAVFGTLTNRVAVNKTIRVESVQGPELTIIQGWQVPGITNGPGAIRCVYLGTNAVLSGFTLTGGGTLTTDESLERNRQGGGVAAVNILSLVTNCILIGNSSYYGGGASSASLRASRVISNTAHLGGGTYYCQLHDCALESNRAAAEGGGAYRQVARNCVFTDNSGFFGGGGAEMTELDGCTFRRNRAQTGGGVYQSPVVIGCTFADNVAVTGGGGISFSTLRDCTLTGNSADEGGGTFRCDTYGCLLRGNSAVRGGGNSLGLLTRCVLDSNSADYGAGTYWGLVGNCSLLGNQAREEGGGSYNGALINCSVGGNTAKRGGGTFQGSLDNSIAYFNEATLEGANHFETSVNSTCTVPLPGSGSGNIIDSPEFADVATGNLRLGPNSPCINSGDNARGIGEADLDGQPRISGGTVDQGAYEFQDPATTISIAWLRQYGLPTDGSADTTDPDLDTFNNWEEWHCGTNPKEGKSAMRLEPPVFTDADTRLRWQSVPGRTYWVGRSASLADSAPFEILATGLPADADSESTVFVDPTGIAVGPRFYRIGVEQ